jgi:hypothetical protein
MWHMRIQQSRLSNLRCKGHTFAWAMRQRALIHRTGLTTRAGMPSTSAVVVPIAPGVHRLCRNGRFIVVLTCTGCFELVVLFALRACPCVLCLCGLFHSSIIFHSASFCFVLFSHPHRNTAT